MNTKQTTFNCISRFLPNAKEPYKSNRSNNVNACLNYHECNRETTPSIFPLISRTEEFFFQEKRTKTLEISILYFFHKCSIANQLYFSCLVLFSTKTLFTFRVEYGDIYHQSASYQCVVCLFMYAHEVICSFNILPMLSRFMVCSFVFQLMLWLFRSTAAHSISSLSVHTHSTYSVYVTPVFTSILLITVLSFPHRKICEFAFIKSARIHNDGRATKILHMCLDIVNAICYCCAPRSFFLSQRFASLFRSMLPLSPLYLYLSRSLDFALCGKGRSGYRRIFVLCNTSTA